MHHCARFYENIRNIADRYKRIIWIFQLVVAILLLIFAVYKVCNVKTEEIDMSQWSSDYMSYQDGSWVIGTSQIDGEEIDIILSSDFLHLDADSYTIYIRYHGDTQVKCYLSNQGRGLHANKFFVSKNKEEVKYDFFASNAIDQFQINITDYEDGNFSLDGITIETNGANSRLLLLAWILFVAVFNFIFYSKCFAQHSKEITALVLLSLIVTIPNALYGIHIGHDMTFHLQRIEGIAQSLAEGQFPARMNTTFNDGYGYPVGVFYGDLLLYIPALLRLVGLSVLTTYKSYIWLTNIFTLATAYYCAMTFFDKKKISLLVALAYTASSYRLMDIYVRSALGEYTALIFLPIVAASLCRIYTEDTKSKNYQSNAVILSLGMIGLLYSHILTTEMAVVVCAVTAIIFIKKTIRRETLIVYVKGIGLFLALGLAYILPFLDYYINTDTVIKDSGRTAYTIQKWGAYISQYFAFFRTIYGANDTDPNLRMQLTPGLLLMLTLLIAFIVIVLKMADKKIYYLTAMSVLMLFVSSNLFPWDTIAKTTVGNMLAAVQFPWRYLGFATLFLALLLGALFVKLPIDGRRQAAAVCIAGLVILVTLGLFTISYRGGVAYLSYVDTQELPQYIGVDTNGKEYLLTDTDIEDLDYEVTSSSGTAEILSEDGLDMELKVEAKAGTTLEVPRFAYRYLTAIREDGQALEVSRGSNNKLAIKLDDQYSGNIYITYREPWLWRVSELISLFTLVGVVFRMHKYSEVK